MKIVAIDSIAAIQSLIWVNLNSKTTFDNQMKLLESVLRVENEKRVSAGNNSEPQVTKRHFEKILNFSWRVDRTLKMVAIDSIAAIQRLIWVNCNSKTTFDNQMKLSESVLGVENEK